MTALAETSLMLEVQVAVQAIKENGYYLHIWEEVKHKKPLVDCSRQELLKPFQDFWSRLPDSGAIHRYPFFTICDLAERYAF